MQGVERWRRRGAFLHGPTEPRLLLTLPRYRGDHSSKQSRGGKHYHLRRRRRGKWLRRLCVVALAAVSRGLASHRMLAVALAAVLCHCDSASAFLEAGKTRSGQKRAKGQDCYTCYPQTMSATSFHRTLLLTKQPESSRQSLFSFSRRIGTRFFGFHCLLRCLQHYKVSSK